MFLVQLVLITREMEAAILDQFYLGLYSIGIGSIFLTNLLQTFHSDVLSKNRKISNYELQNLYQDCLVSLFIIFFSLVLLVLYLNILNLKSFIILFVFSCLNLMTVLGSQYYLFKKKYYLSHLYPTVFGVLILLISILGFKVDFINLFIYSILGFLIVISIFFMKNYYFFKRNLRLLGFMKHNFFSYIETSLKTILTFLQVGPSFYIIIVASVLFNNFVSYASFFGFYYSFIGVFSVILGQNLFSVLLAQKSFTNLHRIRNVFSRKNYLKFIFSFVCFFVFMEIFKFSVISIEPFFLNYPLQLGYLKFLIDYYYAIFSCIAFFVIWNLLRGHFITIRKPNILVIASSLGFICVFSMSYLSILFDNPSLVIYAIPVGLLVNIFYLFFNLSFCSFSLKAKN